MSSGELRKEIAGRFGDFFSRRGFVETYYFYDEKSFGNEILEFAGPEGIKLRFVRDRSQIFADIAPSKMNYILIDHLLQLLGIERFDYGGPDGNPAYGMPAALEDQIKKGFDDVLALIRAENLSTTRARLDQLYREIERSWEAPTSAT
jgi:hypothetical protein